MTGVYTPEQVCAQLRALIEERYASQSQAARAWKMTPQALNDIVHGRRQVPPELLAKLGLARVIRYIEVAP
jgi:plasmid maintenance system antidote protein VapI